MFKKLFLAAAIVIASTGGNGDVAYAKPTFTGIPNQPECVFGQDYVNMMAERTNTYVERPDSFKDEWIKLEPMEEMMAKGAYTIGSIQIASYVILSKNLE